MARKYYVLSRRIIEKLKDPTLRFGGENTVVLPIGVLEYIYSNENKGHFDEIKRKSDFIEYIRNLDYAKLCSEEGIRQRNGSFLRVMDCESISEQIMKIKSISTLYMRTFQCCLEIKEQTGAEVILISQNPSICIKAKKLGIKSRAFKDETFPAPKDQYTGKVEVFCSQEVLNKFFQNEEISKHEIYKYQEYSWYENMFVIMKTGNSSSGVGRYEKGKIVKLKYQQTIKDFKPQNLEQKLLMECLLAPPDEAPLVIIKGTAGTGKTYCALSAAYEQLDMDGKFRKEKNSLYEQIVVSAPTKSLGEEIGFLPGNKDEKVDPFLGGINDNFYSILKNKSPEQTIQEIETTIDLLREKRLIETLPITFLRGRSIPDRFFILDETQNVEPEIIKDIVTRIGKGSKLILAGDPDQVNAPGLNTRRNGLVYASEMLKGIPLCWQITFNSKKTIRSPLAQIAQEIL